MGEKRSRGSKAALYITLGLVSFLMVLPFLWFILMSFKTQTEIFNNALAFPRSFRLDNYAAVLKVMNIPLYFMNSAIVAVSDTAILMLVTLLSSYALARLRFRSRSLQSFIYYLFLSGLTVPVFVTLFGVYKLTAAFHLVGTRISLILPYVCGGIAFNTLLFVGQLKSFPAEIEEAAVIDGCSLLKLLVVIVFPIMKPTITTAFIFNIIGAWNEFPLAAILIIRPSMRTVPLATSLFKGLYDTNYAAMTAALVLTVLPQIFFYAIFQKYIIEGMTAGSVKG